MRDQQPAPLVPVMPTADDDVEQRTHVRSDGGEPRSLPPKPTDAPLVPDCS